MPYNAESVREIKIANTFSVRDFCIFLILGLKQPQAGIRERLRRCYYNGCEVTAGQLITS